MGIYVYNPDRLDIATPSPVVVTGYLLSTLMSPKTIHTNLYAVFLSFSSDVSILISLTFLISSVVNSNFNSFNFNYLIKNLGNSLFYHYSLILSQGVPTNFTKQTRKPVFFLYCLTAFYFIVLFGNNLLATLNVESKLYVNNWRELNNSDIKALVFKGSFTYQGIVKKSNLNCRIEIIERNALYKPFFLEKLFREKAVLISESLGLDLFKTLHSGVDFYRGKNDEIFAMAGYLFNPLMSKVFIKDANQMYVL